MAFPSRPGGEGAPLGGGRKPGWDGDAHFCGNPEVSLWGLEGRPGVGVEVGGSLQLTPGENEGGAVVTAWSASLLLPHTANLDGRGNPEMNVVSLFEVLPALEAVVRNSWLFIAFGNKTIKALKTALLCTCQGDGVGLPRHGVALQPWVLRRTVPRLHRPHPLVWRTSLPAGQAHARSRERSCWGGGYSMPLRRIWLAAISMTLMMKAMAKAQMRLFRTQVCLFCFWECTAGRRGGRGAEGQEAGREGREGREK